MRVARVVGGALALIALAGGVFWALRPPNRFIYGAAAIAPDEAVFLTRHNETNATHFWVELVKAGEVAWSSEVSPVEPHEALGFTSVAANADVVVVMGERSQRIVVMVLARATGKKLWEATPSQAVAAKKIGETLLIDGPRVYATYETATNGASSEHLTALSLADGARLWSLAADESRLRLTMALRAPGRLLVGGAAPGAELELDGATGKTLRTFPRSVTGCSIPGGWLSLTREDVAVVGSTGEEPPQRFPPNAAFQANPAGPCGERGGDVVVGLMHGDRSDAMLERIERSTGASRWRLELGSPLNEPIATADGRLPRFLPVQVRGKDGADNDIVVVDLDEGKVIERSPTKFHTVVFVTSERAFAWSNRVFSAFDPATGRLAKATAIDFADTHGVRRDDFRFGQLWRSGSEPAKSAKLPWVVFDLRSAKPVRTSGKVSLRDVTDAGRPR